MKFKLVFFLGSIFFSSCLNAALDMRNIDESKDVIIIGDTILLNKSERLEITGVNDRLINVIRLLLPDGWSLYIHKNEANTIVDFNGGNHWLDLLIEILEENDISATIDVGQRRIDVNSTL